MTEAKTCPKCGAKLPENAPGGICPKCLMGAGLESELNSQSGQPKSDAEAPKATFEKWSEGAWHGSKT